MTFFKRQAVSQQDRTCFAMIHPIPYYYELRGTILHTHEPIITHEPRRRRVRRRTAMATCHSSSSASTLRSSTNSSRQAWRRSLAASPRPLRRRGRPAARRTTPAENEHTIETSITLKFAYCFTIKKIVRLVFLCCCHCSCLQRQPSHRTDRGWHHCRQDGLF